MSFIFCKSIGYVELLSGLLIPMSDRILPPYVQMHEMHEMHEMGCASQMCVTNDVLTDNRKDRLYTYILDSKITVSADIDVRHVDQTPHRTIGYATPRHGNGIIHCIIIEGSLLSHVALEAVHED